MCHLQSKPLSTNKLNLLEKAQCPSGVQLREEACDWTQKKKSWAAHALDELMSPGLKIVY